MDKNRETALVNIYKTGRGYMKELRTLLDEELMKEFISVGFIICGYTRTSKTWRISDLCRSYVEELQLV